MKAISKIVYVPVTDEIGEVSDVDAKVGSYICRPRVEATTYKWDGGYGVEFKIIGSTDIEIASDEPEVEVLPGELCVYTKAYFDRDYQGNVALEMRVLGAQEVSGDYALDMMTKVFRATFFNSKEFQKYFPIYHAETAKMIACRKASKEADTARKAYNDSVWR